MIRFFVKSAFFLGLAAMVLPSHSGGDGNADGGLDVFGTLAGAQAAISDLSGFCERAPAACNAGGSLMRFAGERVGDGLSLAYSMVDGPQTAEPRHAQTAAPGGRVAAMHPAAAGAHAAKASETVPAAIPSAVVIPGAAIIEAAVRARPLEDRAKAGAAPSDPDPTMTGAVGQALLMAMPSLIGDRPAPKAPMPPSTVPPANLPIPQPAPRT
ncbi:DUF5330 domain-containing protein [Aurantimonas sp. VKM B-3413]|uniref:DUF5330 domain-containing protein n=1 Tax=Aurantimonas sp. VKM B-3413 TaxID=2779401 RepID=UPI001E59B5E3|nr:DUF5330 domain-containing protein [Aurantimonas sp. VKM B-3413]MCB8838858.1 DUF5330 domain-containing protein [Aurantimonas sp. VKM B-3413]